jgi:alkylated DNA repair dioxygenase AlkB
MNAPVQANLFTSKGDISVDAALSTARRTRLDTGSWVEIVPFWLSGADALFARLQAAVPWKEHYRRLFDRTFLEPRLTAEYGDVREAPEPLASMADVLSRHYRIRYDSLWLNLYRDGRDSAGWHRDRFSCRKPECIVPVLTLGATRRFLIKPRHGGSSVAFSPGSGDLIVMGGRCQQDWVHGVPKAPLSREARISVNFQSSAQARRPPGGTTHL